jgi:hypothetical protein
MGPTRSRPAFPPPTTDLASVRCASCAQEVRREDSTECAICKRRVCLACVGPYGHHMRACDECRLAPW